MMLKLLVVFGLVAGLTGCVVAPAYGPYGYGYAPGYVVAPSVDIGIGGDRGGWHGR